MSSIDHALLESDSWFGAVPAARRALLLAQASVRSVAAWTRLYGVGDPPDGLWAVLDGQVRLIGYPAVGAELVVLMMGPGTWFGELSTLDAGPRPHDAVAFGPARVLHIGIDAFRRLAGATPELWWDIALLACAHQRASLAFMMNTLAQPILVNRPIVVTPKGTKLCRPSEAVLELLEKAPESFTKEDGEVVRG